MTIVAPLGVLLHFNSSLSNPKMPLVCRSVYAYLDICYIIGPFYRVSAIPAEKHNSKYNLLFPLLTDLRYELHL